MIQLSRRDFARFKAHFRDTRISLGGLALEKSISRAFGTNDNWTFRGVPVTMNPVVDDGVILSDIGESRATVTALSEMLWGVDPGRELKQAVMDIRQRQKPRSKAAARRR